MTRRKLIVYIDTESDKYCGNCKYLSKGVVMGPLSLCKLFGVNQYKSLPNENDPEQYMEERVPECLQAES